MSHYPNISGYLLLVVLALYGAWSCERGQRQTAQDRVAQYEAAIHVMAAGRDSMRAQLERTRQALIDTAATLQAQLAQAEHEAQAARTARSAATAALYAAQAVPPAYPDTNLSAAVSEALSRTLGHDGWHQGDTNTAPLTCLSHSAASYTLYTLDVLYPLATSALSRCTAAAAADGELIAQLYEARRIEAERVRVAEAQLSLLAQDQALRLARVATVEAQRDTYRRKLKRRTWYEVAAALAITGIVMGVK